MRTACLLVLVNGCAWILGAEPGKLDDGSDDGPHELCPGAPDAAAGIFVARSGVDSAGCGGSSAPCATIQAGIDAATAAGKRSVFVARGTYVEAIRLSSGITVHGGFELQSGRWGATCDAVARAIVTIRAPTSANVTARAPSLGPSARLVTLTVRSKDTAGPSESLFGVMIASGGSVELEDVDVVVANAGDGNAGTKGAEGTKGASGCTASTGATGSGGMPGTAATPGAFSEDGFAPGNGGAGGAGTNGQGGTSGSPSTCVDCVACNILQMCVSPAGKSCGIATKLGCGGGGGAGGAGGFGGGSSVGVFAWNGSVSMHGGTIHAGDGGRGGGGGSGGEGGSGGASIPGADGPTCAVGCDAVLCTANSTDHGRGGGAGSAGGTGGAGGAGGGGAGGMSYAIVGGGSATVMIDGTGLFHGVAGTGAGSGASGTAGDRFP